MTLNRHRTHRTHPVQVTIEDGWSTGEVGSALAQADVVGSAFAFRIWSTVTGAGPFEPGTYTLRTNMCDRAAANVLKAGQPVEPEASATLLIPPGLTLNQVAAEMASARHDTASIRPGIQPALPDGRWAIAGAGGAGSASDMSSDITAP